MGACCSCFRIREEAEVVSPRWTPGCIPIFWDKFTGVNSNMQSEDRARYDGEENESIILESEERSTARCFKSRSRLSYLNLEPAVACGNGSSEDEDVCPTCLEEYNTENPQIVLRCSHRYHLSCIYEWMKRSANCPICDKMMVFDEV